MNRTLLNMLRTYVERAGDWEEHLQLLLFAYHTTKHSSTGLSPHEVLFGYNPPSPLDPNQNVPVALEPSGYCEQLQKKLLELKELVEANIVEAAARQQSEYPSEEATKESTCDQSCEREVGSTMDWTVDRSEKSGCNQCKGQDGNQRAGHSHQPDPSSSPEDTTVGEPLTWTPPLFTHSNLDTDDEKAVENTPIPGDDRTVRTTRNGREIHPVVYYGY